MKIGIYIRNIEMIGDIQEDIMQQAECIACGDYACPRNLPQEEEVLRLNEILKKQNKTLQYISPKLSQAYIEGEYKRVLAFMNQGISISVNDWGLLYKLRPHINEEHDICIGRVLSKSIADWYWQDIFLGFEKEKGRRYLQQNNFNHKAKIDYFRGWGVKGVEVSINNVSEDSYKGIHDKGMYVIGFADSSILGLARACPATNIQNDGVHTEQCKGCRELFHLVPKKEEHKDFYPKIMVSGKVIFSQKDVEPNWDGYKRIMYTWGMGKP
ncbi:MAG TPA: hypothetical protein VHT34_06025 [Clostridia bacterium]|nr:hypothetical protein [Clostridia bacterium]